MNVSKRCAAVVVTATLSGAATLGMAGPAFAHDDPHGESVSSPAEVASAPAHRAEEGGTETPAGQAQDSAAPAEEEGAEGQQDPESFLPGTVSIGGVPPTAQPGQPPVDGPNLHDLTVLIAGLSETCLNPLAVGLEISPDGETALSLTADDIAEALLQAGPFAVLGGVGACVADVATQLIGGNFPPEATARYAEQLGINLADPFTIQQVE